jgi:hypothetical protein
VTPLLLFFRLTESWDRDSEVNKIVNSSIRVIKRGRGEDANDLKTAEGENSTSEGENSVERSTRDMVRTVKSWIAELQERKRAQRISTLAFSRLTIPATTPAQQDT